jgi:ABC-2 type transport system ATP-binding protein
MIEVKSLVKSYGEIKAVNGVSFTVNSGGVVGLLGPNGAGKTTTLNMITGVLIPDSGSVVIDGVDLSAQTRELKKEIGYLAEDNPLYDSMLVSELLEFVWEVRGLESSEFRKDVESIVHSTGIKDIFYRPISTLSKGLRQRVGIAQALLGDPKILILDEPTEGLDPNQRQEIRQLITEMAKDHTVLMSTHVMQEVEAICEEVIILNNGEVAVKGSVEEITSTQGDLTVVEMEFNRNRDGFKDELMHRLEDSKLELEELEQGRYVVHIDSQRSEDLFKAVARLTDEEWYLASMKTRRTDLEEVFAKLTKDV